MPVIETRRLILRPFTERDAADLYAYASDPRVGPIAGWPPHRSEAESREIIRTVFSQPGVFAIGYKETGAVVGSIGFVHTHPAGERADCPDDEVGYALSSAYWGRGLMPEALAAVIGWGFEELGLQRIWCAHYAGNWRSRRCMVKCGFRYQFARVTRAELMGEERETYFYLLTKEDWLAHVSRSI